MTEVRPETAAAQSSLGASCVLGDGYVIPDGGHLVIYPVSCGSDCFDFPNGGLDFALFCVNGVLGPNDPLLTGGTVGPPYLTASIYNGYSRCTALPNGHWHQSANRKTCVWVP